MKKIILASKSPRRKQILEMLDWDFSIDSCDTKEIFQEGISIEENMKRIALEKAKVVAEKYQQEIILACDTMVVLENQRMGKPKDEEDAKEMLRNLSGKLSYVYSAVALLDQEKKREEVFIEKTKIYFYTLSEQEIEDYVATGESKDKAGAYAIQGLASIFIEKIEGDYWNVVGLPIAKVYHKLKEWNYL